MVIELRELTLNDGKEIFDMLKEIGPGENGFENRGYDMEFSEFPEYLKGHYESARSINLKPEYVPQTIYWLYVDEKPVGMIKLRHYLNDNLRKHGGHIGYTIRPTERGKGYGSLMLKEVLKKAKEKDINEAMLTCDEVNTASRRVMESNGGVLESAVNGECIYWIKGF